MNIARHLAHLLRDANADLAEAPNWHPDRQLLTWVDHMRSRGRPHVHDTADRSPTETGTHD